MGMYTELHYNVELKKDTPDNVIKVLKYMVGDTLDTSESPDHALFSASRWDIMLRCDSYYFNADTHSTLRYDEMAKAYFLCVRSNLKNYSDEIALFIDWMSDYISASEGEFLGFWRYEGDSEPTLIHHQTKQK